MWNKCPFLKEHRLDVCLGLDLRVHGETIKLDEIGVHNECKKLFNNKTIDVHMVYIS